MEKYFCKATESECTFCTFWTFRLDCIRFGVGSQVKWTDTKSVFVHLFFKSFLTLPTQFSGGYPYRERSSDIHVTNHHIISEVFVEMKRSNRFYLIFRCTEIKSFIRHEWIVDYTAARSLQVIYGKLRRDISQILVELCRRKGIEISILCTGMGWTIQTILKRAFRSFWTEIRRHVLLPFKMILTASSC